MTVHVICTAYCACLHVPALRCKRRKEAELYLCNVTYSFVLNHYQNGQVIYTENELKELQQKILDETGQNVNTNDLKETIENLDAICSEFFEIELPKPVIEKPTKRKTPKELISKLNAIWILVALLLIILIAILWYVLFKRKSKQVKTKKQRKILNFK